MKFHFSLDWNEFFFFFLSSRPESLLECCSLKCLLLHKNRVANRVPLWYIGTASQDHTLPSSTSENLHFQRACMFMLLVHLYCSAGREEKEYRLRVAPHIFRGLEERAEFDGNLGREVCREGQVSLWPNRSQHMRVDLPEGDHE